MIINIEVSPKSVWTEPILKRLLKKIVIGPVPEHRPDLGPCWLWTGGLAEDGYGLTTIDKKTRGAHCVLFEIVKGPIPEGLELDHLCRVRRCVNPDHCEPVTHAVNCQRADHTNNAMSRRTACPQGHPLVDGNIVVSLFKRLGHRKCLISQRGQARLWAQKGRIAA
jgi:hypothetical protein